ncbi:hypothetical protein F5B20DRAFT_507358 [Whalleya microplaca]|nr:hypothetical protein F5B20DRAFT_507358 [Whalleya microplaca]
MVSRSVGRESGQPMIDNRPPATDGTSSYPSGGGNCTAHQHQTAIASLANLPFKLVVAVFRHQWHKDKARITFAHAEQYVREHDFPKPKSERPNWSRYRPHRWRVHAFQLSLLRGDLVWHREKFIKTYLDAIVQTTRPPMEDHITPEKAQKLRDALTLELRVSLPSDLCKVYYGKIPPHMDEIIDLTEVNDLGTQFGAERDPMVLAVPIALHIWSVNQDFPDLLPKNPALWVWSMPADIIEATHWKIKGDLF